MKKELYEKIFIIVFSLNIILSAPYIIVTQIIKDNDNIEEYDDEYILEEDNEEEIDLNEIISNIDMDVYSNIKIEENKNNLSNSNKVSNKTTSNKTKPETKKTTSSNKTTSNKIVSNKTTSNNSSNSTTSKENTVKNPGMSYKGFTNVSSSYFNDALFIGDSRTVGIRDYGTLKNATYFCDVGMSSFNIYNKSISVKGVGKVSFEKLLSKKKFGKVYIMLGINELGYNFNNIITKYKSIVNLVKKYQPDAIIYIEGNLHVSKTRNDKDKVINNNRINRLNSKMSLIANNSNIFYIDINELFDDKDGNLISSYTSDGTHVYAKYYKDWCNWLMKHAVVK